MKVTDLRDEHTNKPLPKSFQNTLVKLVANGKLKAEYPDDTLLNKTTRVNPYSGVKVTLSLLAADLADWICSNDPIGKGKGFTRSDWDNARYTFNVCWSKAYYDLID
jgi:hypothetical protein